jgi:hypothetical protein
VSQTYIGRKSCGCVVAAAVVNPADRKATAQKPESRMKQLALLLLSCSLAVVLSGCHDEDHHNIFPSPIPSDTPCPGGSTRPRSECLKACKKACVDQFPGAPERRECIEGCRTSCYEQFPVGACLEDALDE